MGRLMRGRSDNFRYFQFDAEAKAEATFAWEDE